MYYGHANLDRVLALHRSTRDLRQVWCLEDLTELADRNSIGKSDDDLGRMLEVLRFWFTKDLVRLRARKLTRRLVADYVAEIREREALQAIQLYFG